MPGRGRDESEVKVEVGVQVSAGQFCVRCELGCNVTVPFHTFTSHLPFAFICLTTSKMAQPASSIKPEKMIA